MVVETEYIAGASTVHTELRKPAAEVTRLRSYN